MKADEINKLINDPRLLASTDTGELRKLVNKYPYFQCAQMLLTQKLHSESDVDAPAQIRNAACSLPSGEKLYRVLFKDRLMKLIEEEHEADTPEPETAQTAFVTPIPFQSHTRPEPVKTEQPQKEETPENQAEETAAPASPPEEKPADTQKPDKHKSDELEEEILKHATEVAYSLTPPGKTREVKSGSDRKEEKQPEKKKAAQPQSFSNWLKALDEERFKEIREKDRKEETGKLIDEFIEKQPSIKPADEDEVFNPGNLAKLSVVEDEGFVSETLAQIYSKQGNLPKAEKIYNKLMLKYPEKKAYFARQIEKLDKKQK